MQTEQSNIPLRTTQFVLFGALGDLAWRFFDPALFKTSGHLYVGAGAR